jgi:hypothetical protein
MLQVCLDESGKGGSDVFVMAGYVSTTELWAGFSDEWQALLDYRSAHYRKLDYFKMSEMTASERDMKRARWFYRVIKKYALAAVSFTIPIKLLDHEVRRMFGDPNILGVLSNPWHFATHLLMPRYAEVAPSLGLPPGPLDFVFDETGEKNVLIAGWENSKAFFPKAAPMMGSTPIFRKDHEYLPLQAADLLAWWIRHRLEAGIDGERLRERLFPWPRSGKEIPWSHMSVNRSAIQSRLRMARKAILGGVSITMTPTAS